MRQSKRELNDEIRRNRNAVLIVNTLSRSGAAAFSKAKDAIIESGMALKASHAIRHGRELSQIVQQEIASGHNFLIVGGGDGSISSVAGLFAYRDVALGILPLGTANSFARGLGIPLDLEGAIDVLVQGAVEDIDLGEINRRYFINGASIGMPALVASSTPRSLKKHLGRVAYALTAAAKFFRYEPFCCRISVDCLNHTLDTLEVRIANGAYEGGVLVTRSANPENGSIVIRIVLGRSKWTLAREWGRIALRLPFEPAPVKIVRNPRLFIATSPDQPVAVDGEPVANTPLNISVAARALRIMLPKPNMKKSTG